MFNRSRKKIILSIVGSLILLFGITLSVIMLDSYHEILNRNREMLERYVEIYSLERQPGSMDIPLSGTLPPEQQISGQDLPAEEPPLDSGPDFQLSTFYSVAFDDDGTVLAVDDGKKDIYNEEELITIARKILSGGKSSGSMDHLIYRTARKPDCILVAFIDKTVSESSLNTLQRSFLTVGGAAIVLLFFLSLYLSGKIIEPLEENDRKQRQFISDAGHELKTPLAVISANADMLMTEIGENEWLDNIRYENGRMDCLVRQLLDLSRAENTEGQVEQVDFSRIVTGEMLAFDSLAYENGKTIHSDIEENIRLSGSPAELSRLVSVLLDNALRYSTGRDIEISLKRKRHEAVLDLINDSEPIPYEKQEHLFDRFYRVDEARSSDSGNYGLGLSIAKTIAEKHGGSIAFSFHDGKVQFTVFIPSGT